LISLKRFAKAIVPHALGWKALLPLDGPVLEEKYREILEKLALKNGMLRFVVWLFRQLVRHLEKEE
jgi:hypothetical protein